MVSCNKDHADVDADPSDAPARTHRSAAAEAHLLKELRDCKPAWVTAQWKHRVPEQPAVHLKNDGSCATSIDGLVAKRKPRVLFEQRRKQLAAGTRWLFFSFGGQQGGAGVDEAINSLTIPHPFLTKCNRAQVSLRSDRHHSAALRPRAHRMQPPAKGATTRIIGSDRCPRHAAVEPQFWDSSCDSAAAAAAG